MTCENHAHDFENARQRGRATWICPRCDKDISIEFLYWWDATHPNELDPGEDGSAGVTVRVEPCPDPARMGEFACSNRHQCWEPCGELGNDENHVKVHNDNTDREV